MRAYCVFVVASIFSFQASSRSTDVRNESSGDTEYCKEINGNDRPHICGKPGLSYHPNYAFGEITVQSEEECASFCLNNDVGVEHYEYNGYSDRCEVFSYNTKTGACKFYPDLPASVFTPSPKSPVLFWSSRCYLCEKACRINENINHLENPGFELSATLKGPWEPEGYGLGSRAHPYIVTPGYKSNNALAFDGGIVTQGVRLCPGRLYYYKFHIKLVPKENAGQNRKVSVWTGDLMSNLGLRPNQWHTIVSSAAARSYDAMWIHATKNGYITYVDGFELRAANGLTTTTGPNLLKNGGFESGVLAPWSFTTFDRFNKPGQYAIVSPGLTQGKFTFTFHQNVTKIPRRPAYFQPHGGLVISQSITTSAFKHYQLSFDFLSEPTINHKPGYQDHVYPEYKIKAGFNVWSLSLDGEYRKYRNYQLYHFSRVFTANQTRTKISIEFYTSDLTSTRQKTLLDNVQVREVPASGNIGIVKGEGIHV